MATSKKTTSKKKVVAKKEAVKKAPAKKALAKKAVLKKAPAAKAAAKPAPKKAAVTKKVATKKVAAKKVVASKTVAEKPAIKKSTTASTATQKPVTPAPKKSVSASKKSTGKSVPVVDGIEPYHEAPGEDYMNDDQREHFRSILQAWKQDLMQEVDRTVHHMQDEAANFPDPNDRATQESEFSMELRARDRERKLIKKIDETIAKLDHDDYGYCDSCGVEIGIRRLEARPTAALCIDCKTLDEIREKQMGG